MLFGGLLFRREHLGWTSGRRGSNRENWTVIPSNFSFRSRITIEKTPRAPHLTPPDTARSLSAPIVNYIPILRPQSANATRKPRGQCYQNCFNSVIVFKHHNSALSTVRRRSSSSIRVHIWTQSLRRPPDVLRTFSTGAAAEPGSWVRKRE